MLAAAILAALSVVAAAEANEAFKLLVLHTNDMHARFEQTDRLGGKCRVNRDKGCYGGYARLVTAVRNIRDNSRENVIFLNAGDTYQGTVWYTAHKWSIVARFNEFLGLDAMSLGNHEFDDEVAGLVPFVKNISTPVLAANLDSTEEPTLKPYIKASVVLRLSGTRVGVIGYLTPATKEISQLGKVKLFPEVESVAKEAAKLKAEGVRVIIALGHSGYKTDLDIAQNVPDVDLVIGGHTNTFLYTGTPPDSEKPVDVYPKIVQQKSGRKVAVVQAFAYTKYLGYLNVAFDEDGELVRYGGNPILLNSEVPEDEEVLKELDRWYPKVASLSERETGSTRVLLDGTQSFCRNVECNLGNLIADAMVYYHFETYSGKGWSDGAIAIQHGGGIRTSIEETAAKGTITMGDVLTVLPFENAVFLVQLLGKHIREMLEFSASFHDPQGSSLGGGFLQLSGLYVRYNMSRPIGNRTMEIKVRCSSCRTPVLNDLNPDEIYSVLMPSFLAEGGDGYRVIKNNIISSRTQDVTDTQMLANYLRKKSPVYHGVEWRIQIVYSDMDLKNQEDHVTEMTASLHQESAATHFSTECVAVLFVALLNLLLN
ncbi:protein 5NUC-like [Ischnura elegans]|uniref:protein 5NUC-like n=1 Tax=Ischnura elegans TaxID=197161 RepID=UPI001ED87F26|nr:protein 5NUC-like [Ischnura elegans]